MKMVSIEFSLESALLTTAALTDYSPMYCSNDLNMLICHSFCFFYYCSVQFPAQLPSFTGRPDLLGQQPGPDEDWRNVMGICRAMTHITLFLNHEESYFMNGFMCNSHCQIWVDLHKGSDLIGQHTKCQGDSAVTMGQSRAMFPGNCEPKDWGDKRWWQVRVLRRADLKDTVLWKSVHGKGASRKPSSASQRKRVSCWIHSKRKRNWNLDGGIKEGRRQEVCTKRQSQWQIWQAGRDLQQRVWGHGVLHGTTKYLNKLSLIGLMRRTEETEGSCPGFTELESGTCWYLETRGQSMLPRT